MPTIIQTIVSPAFLGFWGPVLAAFVVLWFAGRADMKLWKRVLLGLAFGAGFGLAVQQIAGAGA